MKKIIICIIASMLLISVTVISSTGKSNTENITKTSDDYSKIVEKFLSKNIFLSDWSEHKLTASDGSADDNFGISVSIDGNYAVVGAYHDDSGKGSAYVFKRSGSTWTQEQKLTASDGNAGDNFGNSVSINGEYSIVGARYSNSYKGAAYVFKRSGSSWTQEQKLTAADGEAWNYFGCSVSIYEEHCIIGAHDDDDNGGASGSAYVFIRSGSSWTQEQKLTAADGAAWDQFGVSVSLDGESAIVGAFGDDTYTGAAYVFKRSGTTWTQEQKLTALDASTNERFGWSVSINEDSAIIGAYLDDSGKGSAYVFKRSGTTWTQEQKLTAADGVAGDYFGFCVSICGDDCSIGAMNDDNKGSSYMFKRSGSTWAINQKVTAADGEAGDNFGESISIYEGYIIIGARNDDDNGLNSGSAYVFKELIPDLDCVGSLIWYDVAPGGTVTSDFVLANVGDPGSELSWEIDSHPEWGTWTIIPSGGTGLTPEMGTVTVNVEVVAPDEKNQKFNGSIKIVNSEDANDFDIVPIELNTPRSRLINNNFFLKLFERNPLLNLILQKLLGLESK